MNMIVCTDLCGGIGTKGSAPDYPPLALAEFSYMTYGQVVFYGRRTLRYLPDGMPVQGRENLILSRKAWPSMMTGPDIVHVRSLPAAAREILAMEQRGKDVYLIGGAHLFRVMAKFCTLAFLAEVSQYSPADYTLPDEILHSSHWERTFVGEWKPAGKTDAPQWRQVTVQNRNWRQAREDLYRLAQKVRP